MLPDAVCPVCHTQLAIFGLPPPDPHDGDETVRGDDIAVNFCGHMFCNIPCYKDWFEFSNPLGCRALANGMARVGVAISTAGARWGRPPSR
jgi:hypothetical protein